MKTSKGGGKRTKLNKGRVSKENVGGAQKRKKCKRIHCRKKGNIKAEVKRKYPRIPVFHQIK